MTRMFAAIFILAVMLSGCGDEKATFDTQELLNVSYDPTRELYAD